MSTLTRTLKNKIVTDFISSGAVAPGGKLPSIRAIAQKYSSNTTTISKVVAVLAAEGIVTKRHGSGIYCTANARNLIAHTHSSHRKIGFVVHDINTTLGHRLLTGVEASVSNHRGTLEIANSYHDVQLERQHLEAMRQRGVEGVVLKAAPNRTDADEYLGGELRDFPIVLVDDYRPSMRRPSVIFDNFTAGREMTLHLVRQGCQRIAFYLFEDWHRVLEDRLAGYRAALKESGIPFRPELVVQRGALTDLGKHNHNPALSAVAELLALDPQPDAIIAPQDYCASLFIDYLRHNRPQDAAHIIVTGFDNDPGTQDAIYRMATASPAWPTTLPDFRRMGTRATELLLEMLNSKSDSAREVQIVLPCPLLLPRQAESLQSSSAPAASV